MPQAVGLVTIHHEGAGTPTDNTARFAGGGYTYGIGITRFSWFRTVWESFGTLGFNGTSLDVCLSGDRTNIAVTASDIKLLNGAFLDAYHRGYVTADPLVRAHRNSPGSNTVCPGDQTMNVWSQVVAACRIGPPAPPPEDDVPTDDTFVNEVVTSEGTWKLKYNGDVFTVRGTYWGGYRNLPASAQNDPARRFRAITARSDGHSSGYTIWSEKGEPYNFGPDSNYAKGQ